MVMDHEEWSKLHRQERKLLNNGNCGGGGPKPVFVSPKLIIAELLFLFWVIFIFVLTKLISNC